MGCGSSLVLVLFNASLFVFLPKFFDLKGRDDRCSVKRRCWSAVLASLIALATTWHSLKQDHSDLLGRLGLRLHGTLGSIIFPSLLILVLYSGQLLMIYIDGYFESFSKFFSWNCTLGDATWIKNIIVAPITEEIVFRSCAIALLSNCGPIIVAQLLAPALFALAHLHHIYDDLAKGITMQESLRRRGFQVCYTYLFGLYTSYLFINTKNIFAPIVTHMWCNLLGTPLIGEIEYYPKHQRAMLWLTYFIGLFVFIRLFQPLTNESLYG